MFKKWGLDRVKAVEKEAFVSALRYSRSHFRELIQEQDFTALCLRNEQNELIGFFLGYQGESADTFFLDILGLKKAYQGRKIGSILGGLVPIIKSLGYKKANLLCDQQDQKGADLPRFYESLGFRNLGWTSGGYLMEIEL